MGDPMLTRIFARASGLTKIAERFGVTAPPKGLGFDKQTIQVGSVRFRRCVTVHLDEHGFYFWIRVIFSNYPQVLVPWHEIKQCEDTKIYGRRAVAFAVGSPALGMIRVPETLFAQMQPYLGDRAGTRSHSKQK